jgi:hypothetical protein
MDARAWQRLGANRRRRRLDRRRTCSRPAASPPRSGLPLPAGAAVLCPAADLSFPSFVPDPDDATLQTFSDFWRACIDWYVAEHRIDDPLISPALADPSGLPPRCSFTAPRETCSSARRKRLPTAHESTKSRRSSSCSRSRARLPPLLDLPARRGRRARLGRSVRAREHRGPGRRRERGLTTRHSPRGERPTGRAVLIPARGGVEELRGRLR